MGFTFDKARLMAQGHLHSNVNCREAGIFYRESKNTRKRLIQCNFLFFNQKHDRSSGKTFGTGGDPKHGLIFDGLYVIFESEVAMVQHMGSVCDFQLKTHKMPALSDVRELRIQVCCWCGHSKTSRKAKQCECEG